MLVEKYGKEPAIAQDQVAITDPADPTAVFQTLLAADALRYLTLQITASKASGHPGGFASQVEAYAALVMFTKHHYGSRASRPGFIAPCSSTRH